MQWIILLIFAIICAAIASSKGRNPVGWFVIGFLTGLIGLIILLCVGNLREERARQAQQEEENRRLREKLRQEQLKLESLRQHTAQRLDMHDRALSMDTRATAPQMLGAGGYGPPAGLPAPPPVPPPIPPQIETPYPADNRSWHFNYNGQEHGPFTSQQIAGLISTGQITRETLLWSEPLLNWAEAGDLPEFRGLFA